MTPLIYKAIPKSDGNGGSHVGLQPGWIAVIISASMMLFAVGGMVFGYGVKSANINALEKGRQENRNLIDKNTEAISKIIECQTKLEVKLGEIATDVSWLKRNEQKKVNP